MNVHRNTVTKSSLNNVYEPRNAEFMAFLGSFYVVRQSNDNKVGK